MAIRELMVGRKYQVFILDEAHERSINTDVLLAVLKQQLQKSSRLKLIIMSATIDISKFLNFFESNTVHARIIDSTLALKVVHTLSASTTPSNLKSTMLGRRLTPSCRYT